MIRVLVDVDLSEDTLSELRAMPGVQLDLANPIQETARPLPAEQLSPVQVLFCTFPPTNTDDLRSLEWVQLASVGYEQLLPWNLPGRGIRATNAQGVFDVPIGEWCLSMMINMTRDLGGMFRNQQQAVWDRDQRFQTEIRGRNVGFWGFGGLARETARLAKAFGMTVHVLTRGAGNQRENVYCVPGTGDPTGTLPDRVFGPKQRIEFLGGLDFLVLAMPLTPSTRAVVGAEELRALPAHAILLNPARGPLVDEQALLTALREGWFAGAALDTHHHYPLPPDHPLWALPNVIVTPHISGSSMGTFFRERVGEICRINLRRFIEHEPLLNEIPSDELCA